MLDIVIVNGVYPPEPVVSAQIGKDLAVCLANMRHNVTVLCPFPSRPMGVKYPDYKNINKAMVEQQSKIKVVRLPSYVAPESRIISRMRESCSFGWHVSRYMKRDSAVADVVYMNAWPLCGQALIAGYCARYGIPLVIHIQDIYPESLVNRLPDLCGRIVIPPLRALDKWIVRQAAHVVVISANMRETYVGGRGVIPKKVSIVPNWMDEGNFVSFQSRKEVCLKYGIPDDKFTFLYLGNIAPVADVEFLIKTFHSAGQQEAQLIIAGGGSARVACMELVSRIRAENVRFISPVTIDDAPLIHTLAHVCLLSMREGSGLSSIPSKLPSYMFAAKPVLATVDAESDTARFIQEAKCGWIGKAGDVEWLSAKMKETAKIPVEVLNNMGMRGREYGLRHFSKSEGVRKLAGIVLSASATLGHDVQNRI